MPHINWQNIGYRWHFIRRIEAEFILDFLGEKTPKRIIDIACGDGQLSDLVVQKKGAKVFGVDISRELVLKIRPSYCQRSPVNALLALGDVHALPFFDECFDAAICNCSLEHFDHVSRVLEEIWRILVPGGFLLGTVDSFTREDTTRTMKQVHAQRFHVVNYFSKESLEALLEKHDFCKITMQYYLSSFLSHLFFRFFSRRRFQGRLFEAFSPLMFHLSSFSDKFVKQHAGGYGLAFSCQKFH
jgi:ubiquinone/menaquinone biosynthesis C-methylase UbiE